jgi:predicted exporter
MVSKNVKILSFLLPIAMVIGTSIAIEFYKGSTLTIFALFAVGGIILCAYILVLRSENQRSVR